MTDLAAMFAGLEAALASPAKAPFPDFPGNFPDPEKHQVIQQKGISSVSRISSLPKWAKDISRKEAVPARAGGGAGAGAREYNAGRLEILELLEKPFPARGYISSSPSIKLEKERKTGNPPALRAFLTLARDPDVQLAFDERAAFLEYECGLNRAEAEARATNEILPELPAAGIPPAPVPPAGSDFALWTAGLAQLSPHCAPCPDYRGDEWFRVLFGALAFLDAFGAQAETFGWRTHELFGVHSEVGTIRPDHRGALMLTAGLVRAVTADTIAFERSTYRRTPGQPQGVPVWRFGRGLASSWL